MSNNYRIDGRFVSPKTGTSKLDSTCKVVNMDHPDDGPEEDSEEQARADMMARYENYDEEEHSRAAVNRKKQDAAEAELQAIYAAACEES